MQKKPPSSFCAGAAIAAALALGSTGALAQDATAGVPTIAPPAPVAAAPAPVQAPVMTQAPVVQALPATPAAEPAPATESRTRAVSEARRPAARAATSAPATAAVTVPIAAAPRVPAPAAALAPAAVAPAVPAIAPLPEPAPALAVQPADEGLTGAEAGLLGLLAVAGLGGAALIAARSRRRRPVEDEAFEPAPMAQPVPVPVPVAAAIPAIAAEPERPAASPERFAMPAGPVPSGTERDALLQRMVAAPPDAANPFVSRKRRVHRARVLLAERERELRDRSTEPFDWRTYSPAGGKVRDRTDAEISRVPYPT
jgi:hypothetical protein